MNVSNVEYTYYILLCVFIFFFFYYLSVVFFFFFKQKTAYEIKECDWSSDVCSSDLLGVRHGWERLTGPIIATDTHNHIISELNWAPVLEVYCASIETDCKKKITPRNFYRFSMRYPFGIYKKGSEDVVRDPIAVNSKGELICVGEVPENTALYILQGDENSLLRAAGQAARESMKRRKKEITFCLVADCVSRSLFLGDAFRQELKTVQSIVQPSILYGILSIGEIGSKGESYLELFNKTIVIGAFHG